MRHERGSPTDLLMADDCALKYARLSSHADQRSRRPSPATPMQNSGIMLVQQSNSSRRESKLSGWHFEAENGVSPQLGKF